MNFWLPAVMVAAGAEFVKVKVYKPAEETEVLMEFVATIGVC